jgi:cob(I)alamin adenosyltransferase
MVALRQTGAGRAALEVGKVPPLKIYTKTGDDGTTGLLGAGRVAKDDPRIDSYGTVDELNAVLGLARASGGLDPDADALVARVQDELFAVGAALADPDPNGRFHNAVAEEYAGRLEAEIDRLEAELPPLTRFILPGGSAAASHLHLARAVCRRAERLVVHLGRQPGVDVPHHLIAYLNRLSDFLFVLARAVNHRSGVADTPWSGL